MRAVKRAQIVNRGRPPAFAPVILLGDLTISSLSHGCMPTRPRSGDEHSRDSHEAESRSRGPYTVPLRDATLSLVFSSGFRRFLLKPNRKGDSLLGAIDTLRS